MKPVGHLIEPWDEHNRALIGHVHPPEWKNPRPSGRYNLVVIGGGTAGWMTAAGLSNKLKGLPVSIRLIESEEIGTVGVGEATLPHIRAFNSTLNIAEPELMKATEATFKLGIEFCDWGRIGDRYIHPFGDYGPTVNEIPFYHYWLRLKSMGDTSRLDEYSYPILAAESGRFRHPSPDGTKLE